MGKFFQRSCIIALWLVAIFCVLYFPAWDVFPSKQKSINLFVWGNSIEQEILAQFEKESKIKVNLSYYTSNEELIAKIKATKGLGYDLIMPSDYAVKILRKENLLQPIDWSKIDFKSDLYPPLLNHPFDPKNRYSIPFEWEIYGFGIDRRFFKDPNEVTNLGWGAIFNQEQIHYPIAMRNDPVEAFSFASFYLYKDVKKLASDQVDQVANLLKKQHNWVRVYSDYRPDYFLVTGTCPLTVSPIGDIHRIRPLFPFIDFIVPKEGSFVTIENFCICSATPKKEEIYKLLNYLYTTESLLAHYEEFSYLPATMSPFEQIGFTEEDRKYFSYTKEEFSQFHFFRNLIDQTALIKIWVEVKSF